MATNTNWPLVATQVAFNSSPNDPAAVPTWTDLSTRLREFSCSGGRQYEIDQNQSGEADAVFSDKDEALNPANAASPYAGNILPYRQIMQQAMWPPAPVGSAVNLLNATAGYDPSMENTAVGGVPYGTLWFNTSPVVSTSNPFTGSRSLTWAANTGANRYVGMAFYCIPGRQYTASVYVRQSAGNTIVSFINGGASGTSTTSINTYVRLSVTFTATQPIHQFYIGSGPPTSNSTVFADGWQVEPGGSVSTFNAGGPVIYGVFRGYVERWPSEWNHQGLYGMCNVACVDALAVLAQKKLHTELANAILDAGPAYYWRLREESGATSFADSSGNNGPPLIQTDSPYGPATTYESGSQITIPGDPGGTGVAISTADAFPQPATVLQTGSINTPKTSQKISIGGTVPFGFTAVVVVSRTAVHPSGSGRMLTLTVSDFNQRLLEFMATDSPSIAWYVGPQTGFSIGLDSGADPWADGKPHVFVATVAVDATNYTVNGYVDGVALAGNPLTLFTSGFTPPIQATQIQVGGLVADIAAGSWAGEVNRGTEGAVYTHVGLYQRALSAAEVATLSQAAAGFPGESSGNRVFRYLNYGYSGSTSIDFGASTMGVSALGEDTALLDACQGVATTENGNMVADSNGVVVFSSRTSRYLNTTADWVLGELAASGEAPYEQGIKFDFDPARVANYVKVTRTGGVTAVATDANSVKTYFERTFEREINVATDAEAYDAASWFLSQMKDAHVRVEAITLRPSANPALWPVVLGITIGDRVTVKRRAITGGLTMSLDFFVEKISHAHSKGEWTTTLELSPAASRTPWILQDATYGLLGSTTVLGY